MTSVQRILANHRNRVRTGTLVPSSVRPIANGVLEALRARSGSGRCTVSGTYIGTEKAVYDFEILDSNAADAPHISAPVFSGQGNGTLTGITNTADAQTFTVELSDLGQLLTHAGTDLDGVQLRARVPGNAGNLIHLTVDRSTLVYTPTNYSLINELAAGVESIEGPEFDWDTKIMGADGNVPAAAHRISFGDSSSGEVHTQYKKYTNGKWEYRFEPKIGGAQPQGSKVKFVTGGRTITITNGTITETYTDIITLYDLLAALKASSALVEVLGIVSNDRKAGGMAAHDLSTRTDAHFLPSTGSGGYAESFTGISVAPTAATELIEATCWATSSSQSPNASVGNEIWSLKGSVSGDLGNLKTGVPFSSPDFSLTIPTKLPTGFSGTATKGRFSVVSTNGGPRDSGKIMPKICVGSMALGPAAVDQQVELVYTKAPSRACDCDDIVSPDLTNAFCLTGLEGGITTMAYSPANVARLTAMYSWGASITTSNSRYLSSTTQIEEFIKDLRVVLGKYEAVLAKVNGNTTGETNWDTTLASLQADVSASLDVLGPQVPILNARYLFTSYDGNGGYINYGRAPFVGMEVVLSHYLLYIANTGLYEVFEFLEDATYRTDRAATGFVTSVNGATAGSPNLITSTGASSSWQGMHVDYQPTADGLIMDRYETQLNWVLMSAGVSPMGKTDTGTDLEGDGCWEDKDAPYYWTVKGSVGGNYGVAYTGVPYFSSRINCGAAGYRSTHEFAFQINVACEGELVEGDSISLSIGEAGYPSTYNVGDKLYLPIIAAADLYMAGGNDGDNVQTWNVQGSASGARPPYLFDPDINNPYLAAGVGFSLSPGSIPFTVGDKFSFSIEGGHFRWRKNAGAWSATTTIPTTSLSIGDGLSVLFNTASAPSFVTGDNFSFTALQPYAVSNCQKPGPDRWQWSGASANLVVNLGSSVQLSALALAYHTLPLGAVVSVDGGADGLVWDWNESLPYQAGGDVCFVHQPDCSVHPIERLQRA